MTSPNLLKWIEEIDYATPVGPTSLRKALEIALEFIEEMQEGSYHARADDIEELGG